VGVHSHLGSTITKVNIFRWGPQQQHQQQQQSQCS
jgi:hypothetical protein